MSKENGYVGKIKSGGTQNASAPYGDNSATKGNVRVTGHDLRTGKKKSGK